MNLTIEPAQIPAHFRQVARLHQQGITEGFLSTLGIPFLAALYQGISRAPDCGVLIARDGENILGFISYAKDVKACYKSAIRSNFPKLILAMIPNAFRLTIYKKIMETLLYPFKAHAPQSTDTPSPQPHLRPELLSMAVSPETRGKGIGKQLVAAIDTQMRTMNISQYYVVTHALDERSNAFYQSCNFTLSHTFQNHAKPMHEYQKDLRR